MTGLDGIKSLQTAISSLGVNETRPTDSSKAAAARSKVADADGDQASVSAAGGLVAQATAGSDVRTEKVAALQQAIASGTYNVPASAVAGKIVDTLLNGH